MTAMMELHGSTKLSDLLAAYPWLKEELPVSLLPTGRINGMIPQ